MFFAIKSKWKLTDDLTKKRFPIMLTHLVLSFSDVKVTNDFPPDTDQKSIPK